MVKITSSYINFQKNKNANINKFHNIRRKNIINLKLTANTLNTKEKNTFVKIEETKKHESFFFFV